MMGVTVLMTGCATTRESMPAPPKPAVMVRPAMVGGPCTYTTRSGTLTIVGLDAPTGQAPTVHFSFTADGQSSPDSVRLATAISILGPMHGKTLPGRRQTETHGTCSPLAYDAMIGGAPVMLTIISR